MNTKSAKKALRMIKLARQALDAGKLVRLSWCADALDKNGFKKWLRTQINRRITFDDNRVKKTRFNAGYALDTDILRDCQRLRMFIQNRVVFNGFDSGYMRKRYPDLHQRLRNKDY